MKNFNSYNLIILLQYTINRICIVKCLKVLTDYLECDIMETIQKMFALQIMYMQFKNLLK